MKRKGSTTSIVIATIAGLSVLGIAGYRMMAGNCGDCALTGTEAATVQTVAAEGDSCCPLKGDSESTATLVSTEATGEVCSDKAKDCATACDGDTAQVALASTTAEKADCQTPCADKAAQVALASTTCDKFEDCATACAGEACGKDAEACCGKCEKGQELAKAPQ